MYFYISPLYDTVDTLLGYNNAIYLNLFISKTSWDKQTKIQPFELLMKISTAGHSPSP